MAQAYPVHPRPSCHALVVQDRQVLLIQRRHEPFKGWWGLPGGSIDLGETVADAGVRELAEETGLAVGIDRLLGYKDAIVRDGAGRVRFHYVILYLLARPVGGTLQAGSDAAAARWVPLGEMAQYRCTDSVAIALGLAGIGREPG